MVKGLQIVLAIVTLLTTLGALGLGIWSVATAAPVILSVISGMLTAGFGLFVYNDYQRFFGKKQ